MLDYQRDRQVRTFPGTNLTIGEILHLLLLLCVPAWLFSIALFLGHLTPLPTDVMGWIANAVGGPVLWGAFISNVVDARTLLRRAKDPDVAPAGLWTEIRRPSGCPSSTKVADGMSQTGDEPSPSATATDHSVAVLGDENTVINAQTIGGVSVFRGNMVTIINQVPEVTTAASEKAVEAELRRVTCAALARIHRHIPGMTQSLEREEVGLIQGQLQQGRRVLLTGDAGTGKSAIAANVVCAAQQANIPVLFLDARELGSYRNETDLRQHLGLRQPTADVIAELGLQKGCVVIIDQLDSIAGSAAADVVADLAVACAPFDGVQLLVVSRKREAYEARLADRLVRAGFVELASFDLRQETALQVLTVIGIIDPPESLVPLSRNLLNLEVIGLIKAQEPTFDFTTLVDQVDLWRRFLDVLIDKEATGVGMEEAAGILVQAKQLAWTSLTTLEGEITLDEPIPQAQRRLISWDILMADSGRVYRFRREELQSFLAALKATEEHAMPVAVVAALGPHRSRSVLLWMQGLYERENRPLFLRFMREAFNV